MGRTNTYSGNSTNNKKGFLHGLSMHEPIPSANQYLSDEIPTFGRGNQGVKMKIFSSLPTMANNIAQPARTPMSYLDKRKKETILKG